MYSTSASWFVKWPYQLRYVLCFMESVASLVGWLASSQFEDSGKPRGEERLTNAHNEERRRLLPSAPDLWRETAFLLFRRVRAHAALHAEEKIRISHVQQKVTTTHLWPRPFHSSIQSPIGTALGYSVVQLFSAIWWAPNHQDQGRSDYLHLCGQNLDLSTAHRSLAHAPLPGCSPSPTEFEVVARQVLRVHRSHHRGPFR
jgi:hypothetical protein